VSQDAQNVENPPISEPISAEVADNTAESIARLPSDRDVNSDRLEASAQLI
jgi:hypothetical protein